MRHRAEMSVILTLTSGRRGPLERALRALRDQCDAPALEIIVPWDPPAREVLELQPQFPEVIFLPVPLNSERARAGASREHHDLLRHAGLRRASAPVLALLEDHGPVAPDWARAVLDELEARPEAGAVGGSVAFGAGGLLRHALWLCDFGRFAPPVREGPARWVSDVNVAYRREALEAIASVWKQTYREPAVHEALARAGRGPQLSNRPRTAQHRDPLSFAAAARERAVWGRSFAGSRVEGRGPSRLLYAAFTPLLPFLLCARHLRGAHRRGRSPARAWACLPVLFALETCWSFGECLGYVSGSPGKI